MSYGSESLGPPGPMSAPPPPAARPPFALPNLRKGVLDMASTRMKQLQWDKISAEHATHTVWGTTEQEEMALREVILSQGIFSEMEEEFRAKEVSRKVVAKKDHQQLQTHLNYATRQGIEMVLKRIKSRLTDGKQSAPEEVAHLIVQCDQQVLDQSILTELLRYYPESETKGRLGEYKNATDEQLRVLHPADRLVVLLMTVPHLKDKVKGMLYQTRYGDTVEVIKSGLVRIREGSEAIMNAPNFAKLLGVILLFGNYLNATGVKGGAYGFRISSINKLVDTKAADGTTLLHFVERTVSRAFPEIDAFVDELGPATEACRVQLLDLKRDLAELKSANVQHKKNLDRLLGERDENIEDPYSQLMLPFLGHATTELSRLSDQIQYTERVFHDALRFYGEGADPLRRSFAAPKAMPTEEFFGIFKEFLTAYRKCKTDNAQLAQQRALENARRAAAAERERERQEVRARKEAGVDDNSVLESLLASLRSSGGTPRKRRKERRRTREAGAVSGDLLDAGDAAAAATAPNSPSSVAASMLAKLQGGPVARGELGEAAAAAQATAAARADRKRERLERNSIPVLQDLPRPPSSRASSRASASDEIASPTLNVQSPEELRRDDAQSTSIHEALELALGSPLNTAPHTPSRPPRRMLSGATPHSQSSDSLYVTPEHGLRRGSDSSTATAPCDSPLYRGPSDTHVLEMRSDEPADVTPRPDSARQTSAHVDPATPSPAPS